MKYRNGLNLRGKVMVILWLILAIFILYDHFYTKLVGEYGRWWNNPFNTEVDEFYFTREG